MTLNVLLTFIYEIEPDQILGPAWLDEERYEIIANVPKGATRAQVKVMFQNLLAERFKLALHSETRNFEVYELTIARGGPKLRETADPGAVPLKPGELPFRNMPLDKNGFPQMPPGKSGVSSTIVSGVMRSTYRSYTISSLVQALGRELGRITGPSSWAPGRVVDKTGLMGKYDFTLEYASAGGIGAALSEPNGSHDQGGPTIFSALEKQLGLKVTKTKASLDVLVIDQVARVPTEN